MYKKKRLFFDVFMKLLIKDMNGIVLPGQSRGNGCTEWWFYGHLWGDKLGGVADR